VEILCSFFQIYNEKVQDLLNADGGSDLQVRESVKIGVYVEGLRELKCRTKQEVMDLLNYGESNRTVAETAMNATSSRSHSVFCMKLVQKHPDKSTKSTSRLFMADLAGSERVSRSKVTGAGFEEATAINGSLSALGNCINALTEKGRGHIPFRDSKLTFILKDSLGGNAKTTLVIALSPHFSNQEETQGTLRFAERCKKIKNVAKKNVIRSNKELENLVAALTDEVEMLKAKNSLLEEALKAKGGAPPTEMEINARARDMAAAEGKAPVIAPVASSGTTSSAVVQELQAKFDIQNDELIEAQKALRAITTEKDAEIIVLKEAAEEAKAGEDVQKQQALKFKQTVESLGHNLKTQIADCKETTRELEEKAKRLKELEEDNASLRKELVAKDEEEAGLETALKNVNEQDEAVDFELHRAMAEIKSLRTLLAQATGEEGVDDVDDESIKAPVGLAQTQMRLAQVLADSEVKDKTVEVKEEHIHELSTKVEALSVEHRQATAEIRETKADLEMWQSEADEALAKQAHLSVKSMELTERVEGLETNLGDESMQRSMFEMSWRTEIMDREIQDVELRRLQIDNNKLRMALEFEERRNRWKSETDENEDTSVAESVQEVGDMRRSAKDEDKDGRLAMMVTIFEKQTYSAWSGEWKPVEDDAWLGKQLSQPAKPGFKWGGDWILNIDNSSGPKPSTDAEGWGYCAALGSLQEKFANQDTGAKKSLHHFARGRAWIRAESSL